MSAPMNPPGPSRLAFALVLALMLGAAGPASAQALTPAFTYQGELRLASGPATGTYDMEFRLFSAATDGAQIGAAVTASGVAVSGGLFTVPLDFGPAQFAGDRQWLEVRIRPAGAGSYETLAPRTEVTASPYAWGARVALADAVTTTSIVDGTIGSDDINAAQVQRRVTGGCAVGQYVRVVNQDGTVACAADASGSGTVTNIQTGAGLIGGPITAAGTISVAPGGIGAAEINATQVQRRVTGTCPAGQYMQAISQGGAVACSADAIGWGLAGNAGTNAAVNFIGTIDAQPLELRTANARSFRIEPSVLTAGSPALPITTNTIAGSYANAVAAGVRGATIAGGGVLGGETDPDYELEGPNRVTDHYGTVGGGMGNTAGNAGGTLADVAFATVSGGLANSAAGRYSTIAGGIANTTSAELGAVGGGASNLASGFASAVAGGSSNVASSDFAAVVGGTENSASGGFATVGGGAINCAGGGMSWAGGFRAKVRPGMNSGDAGTGCSGIDVIAGEGDAGTFVWADLQPFDFVSTGSNQFLVRASGGMAVNTNNPEGNALRVNGTLRVDSYGVAGTVPLCRNFANQISTCSSSARYKQDITDLALGLEAALRLHAVGYRWKESGLGDVGFVAEEVAAIDERLVTRNDRGEIEGVKYDRLTTVLANAVQELAARNSLLGEDVQRIGNEHVDLQQQHAHLRAEHDALRADQERLAAELAELRALVRGGADGR